jgi:hypothetical protein
VLRRSFRLCRFRLRYKSHFLVSSSWLEPSWSSRPSLAFGANFVWSHRLPPAIWEPELPMELRRRIRAIRENRATAEKMDDSGLLAP